MHNLHGVLFTARAEPFSGKQRPGQFPALVRVHLPDGFQNHLPGDLGALWQFALLAFSGRGLFVEVGLDLLCQIQPGLVLGVGIGVHQGGCRRVAGVALNRLEVAAGLQ